MRSDEPTIPSLEWTYAGAGATRGEPRARERETPTWPTGDERTPRGLRGADRWPKGYGTALALGVSLGANVVLLSGLCALLLLGHLNFGAAGRASSSSGPAAALGTSTVASSPSATPLSGWLRVTPSSVQVGCAEGQRTQFVIVQNTGPQPVHWQVVGVGAADQVGVAVSPNQGDLQAGASLPVQVHNTTHASGPQGVASQHGVLRFAVTPADADAGPAPSLTYTTVDCP